MATFSIEKEGRGWTKLKRLGFWLLGAHLHFACFQTAIFYFTIVGTTS
jgi:hypothetical protein